jgi:hypothetical protein
MRDLAHPAIPHSTNSLRMGSIGRILWGDDLGLRFLRTSTLVNHFGVTAQLL